MNILNQLGTLFGWLIVIVLFPVAVIFLLMSAIVYFFIGEAD